jgi:nucleoside-diphosphate-sugar epimerase
MVATNDRTVTVFGGTGFLGRRIVRHLRAHGFPVRIASRHPDRGHGLFGPDDPQLQSVRANIHDEQSVADALAGAYDTSESAAKANWRFGPPSAMHFSSARQ